MSVTSSTRNVFVTVSLMILVIIATPGQMTGQIWLFTLSILSPSAWVNKRLYLSPHFQHGAFDEVVERRAKREAYFAAKFRGLSRTKLCGTARRISLEGVEEEVASSSSPSPTTTSWVTLCG